VSHDCGCCTTPAATIPAAIENRPWLSTVAYRIGTFATFRKSILDELSRTPELAGLSTRLSDDYTITTVELWAAVADVLTFYQERTANEAFLRTATLRDSVLRLVRLIGYELRPGAAATTQLAFTLDVGATALIPVATRVQSVPAEGEKPQKFETLASVLADARLNKLRVFPAPSLVWALGAGTERAIVAPDAEALATAATMAPGDRVMLYAPSAIDVLTVREVRARDDLLVVSWMLPIKSSTFVSAYDANDPDRRAYKIGRTFHLFGFDAPATVVVTERTNPADPTTTYLTTAVTNYTLHGDGTSPTQISLDGRYPGLKAGSVVLAAATLTGGPRAIPFEVTAVAEKHVDRTATTAKPTTVNSRSDTVTQLDLSPLGTRSLVDLLPTGDIRDVVIHELVGAPLRFWPHAYAETVTSSDVFLPGRRAGWSTMEVGRAIEKGAAKPGTLIDVAEFGVGRTVLLADGKGGEPIAAMVAAASIVGSGVHFEPTRSHPMTIKGIGLSPEQSTPITVLVSKPLGTAVILPSAQRELTVTIGGLPIQTIVLDATTVGSGAIADVASALQSAIRAALPGAPTFANAIAWVIDGAIAVAAGVPGDRIVFGASANDPATVAAVGIDPLHARFLDGVVSAPIAPLIGTTANGWVLVTTGVGPAVERFIFVNISSISALASQIALMFMTRTTITADGRIIVVPRVSKFEPRIFLRLALVLDAPLALDTATATLYGNVAPASHGETVRDEIVGDGDASQPFQHFTLKKKPVTYVPSATPGGVASSLRVLVNGVTWKEVPSLYPATPRDEVYLTRIADDGTLTVRFGDGVTGARVPSGRENIVASYRQGIGVAGRVRAATLSSLLDRPTGVKNATNLTAADGGADPETMARAREAAPGTVRTFGRAVSLRDFEDTALMAGEVAKARATWVWNGERRAIHLTIAAQGGASFSADGLKRMAATLATERDPNHKLIIDNYSPVAVLVDASLIVDDRHVGAHVLAAARAALLAALSFEHRRFAEPVYLSDIFAILQNVDGVLAVDVNILDLKSKDAAFRAAHGVDDTLPQPQAHLLMLPARPVGSSGTVLPAELAWIEVPDRDVTLRASGGLSA
jgi:hypothetical protein